MYQAAGSLALPLLALSTVLIPGSWAISEPVKPSLLAAERNAFHIFNSVHSAMRQWGSSVHHNGMALIPATIPKGTLLYHGASSNATPSSFEWLAFEIEHAESFAHGRPGSRGSRAQGPPHHPAMAPETTMDGPDQRPLSGDGGEKPPPPPPPGGPVGSGYLHTYEAARPLNLLYIDGMSGGKTVRGTLDTQDLVMLRNASLRPPGDRPGGRPMPIEWERARRLCAEVESWGYDGLLRMELGFEVILCNFTNGAVEKQSALRRARADQPEAESAERAWVWKWARAAARRYDGIGGGRVKLDFSRMVSALWYDMDTSNPDPSARDQPRLVSATAEQHAALRLRAREISMLDDSAYRPPPVDWQAVVDMVVARYAEHLPLLVDPATGDFGRFVRDIMALTNTHMDYPTAPAKVGDDAEFERELDALERCDAHFLLPVESLKSTFTEEDRMIYRAVRVVSNRICGALWRARMVVRAYLDYSRVGDDDAAADEKERRYLDLQAAVLDGQTVLRGLMRDLDWAEWKRCRGCKVDEVCFVAIWPFGREVDHYEPSCQNETVLGWGEERRHDDDYWDSRGL